MSILVLVERDECGGWTSEPSNPKWAIWVFPPPPPPTSPNIWNITSMASDWEIEVTAILVGKFWSSHKHLVHYQSEKYIFLLKWSHRDPPDYIDSWAENIAWTHRAQNPIFQNTRGRFWCPFPCTTWTYVFNSKFVSKLLPHVRFVEILVALYIEFVLKMFSESESPMVSSKLL